MIRIFNDTFKTQVIKIYTSVPFLRDELMTQTMMLKMMKVSSPRYPSKTAFFEQLESLYGATVNTSSGVLGNQALFTSTIRTIAGSMVNDEQLLKQVLDFAMHNLFEQTFEDDKLFEQEKLILLHQYKTLQNHKMQYAHIRYKEAILTHHPERYTLEDQIHDLNALSLEDVKTFYVQKFLSAQRIAFATGAFTSYEKKLLNTVINPKLHKDISVSHTPIENIVMNNETIHMTIEQTIIHLGYHFPVYLHSEDHAAAQLMTMILGTHGDSRLFRIVREEQGLCYMITAQYDDEKGLLTIITGVDHQTQQQAMDSIKKVVLSMTEHITDKEIMDAKESFIHMITSNLDKQTVYIQRAFREMIYDMPYDLERRLEDIRSVTKEDINRVAKKLTLILEHQVTGEHHE